ncbi:chloride channel K [Lampris incognitus]|uniref:chloride channel K n=1 Tax=Lampris incognitus TaxID=2546036 RepID=UPI0024B4E269|nr:chloride channel K [Lampris incognitus]
MESLDVTPGDKGSVENWKRENQRETSHNENPLHSDPLTAHWKPWKPYQRPRELVRGCMLNIRGVLGTLGGVEWYGYAALGVLAAVLSFLMDLSVAKLLAAHRWLYDKLEGNRLLQFLCWTLYPVSLCSLSTSFSHNVCPFSAGSGLPEIRTMLAGVDMPHYLSLTNMFAKFLGLTCTLAAGSTVFLGKVGPFVHLSTMVGAYLSQLCTLVNGTKKEKTDGEMMVVAVAVGVASCFGAPVSGVLFSVEVMSTSFALRDYCPCFFSAACGALAFRLLSVWSGERETLQALFKTSFSNVLPFYPLEILLFALLGLLCGVVSCMYLICHRCILRVCRTRRRLAHMLTTEKALYSAGVVFLLASLTFPHSAGQYMASKYTMKQLLTSLLDNTQWGFQSHNASWTEWSSSGSPVSCSLAVFLLMKLWMLVLACTLPLPAGYFMPVFVYGAAMGRLVGEGLAHVSSTRDSTGHRWASVYPGGYALAGAAAFSGAVTHTLSPALLAMELTGQFTHAAPVLLATLVANALARSGQRPSFYDTLSISKRLPHLPSLVKACPGLSSALIGPVLTPVGVVLEKGAGLHKVQHALNTSNETEIPVVDSLDSQILLGTVQRSDLLMLLLDNKNKVSETPLEDIFSFHPTAIKLSTSNTIQEAHSVLSMLVTKILFVTERGKLVGVITWPEMQRILEDLAKEI